MARIEADPIGLEIMWSRLISIVEEMWQTVCRTAYSLIIAEAQDFANEILDPQGNPLAHSPRAMPLFNLTLTRCVKALLEHFPAETLQPGDVLVTNDPWLCAGHLFDIALVTPVFHQGRVVALMGTVGHVSDIGGVKDPLAAREIYDEGVQIPPMKLYEAGRPDRSLFRILAANIRNSDQVLGDIESMVTANALGAQRLVAFMEEYGLQDLAALAAVEAAAAAVDAAAEAVEAALQAMARHVLRYGDVGSPDLTGWIDGRWVGLELKRAGGVAADGRRVPPGVVEPHQQQWHEAARRRGATVVVWRDPREVEVALERVRAGR